MSIRNAVLLLALVLSCSAETLYTGEGDIAINSPFLGSFGPFNVYNDVVLTVDSVVPLVICIGPDAFYLPNATQYNADNCIYFGAAPATPPTGKITLTLPLLNEAYAFGVYYVTGTKFQNTTATVTVTGNNCAGNSYYDGTTCVGATPINPPKFTAVFAGPATQFWTYIVPQKAAELTLSSSGIDSTSLVIWGRYGGVASQANHDAVDGTDGVLTVVAPRPGLWVFAIRSLVAGTVNFEIATPVCPDGTAGSNCSITVFDAVSSANLTAPSSGTDFTKWIFYKKTVNATMPLRVSATTNNASATLPFLYALQGNIPTSFGSSDMVNCNGDYCDLVRTLHLNVTKQEEWFIGVRASPTGNMTFALWWDTICIFGCDDTNHGSCSPSGQCECLPEWLGLNCAISNGLGPQYIVLIIIASLVLASAIIGFVAWAYMRKKRHTYEVVS